MACETVYETKRTSPRLDLVLVRVRVRVTVLPGTQQCSYILVVHNKVLATYRIMFGWIGLKNILLRSINII